MLELIFSLVGLCNLGYRFGHIIQGIRMISSHLMGLSFNFKHISKVENYATHSLAKHAQFGQKKTNLVRRHSPRAFFVFQTFIFYKKISLKNICMKLFSYVTPFGTCLLNSSSKQTWIVWYGIFNLTINVRGYLLRTWVCKLDFHLELEFQKRLYN